MSEPIAWTITLNIANVVGFVYNIPQMIKIWKTKSTKDIDTTGQILRFVCSVVWVIYSIDFKLIDVGISWGVTLLGSLWILMFKAVYEYNFFAFKMVDRSDVTSPDVVESDKKELLDYKDDGDEKV